MFFHTHAPATDRYLARGLSKSVCVYNRKNREICLNRPVPILLEAQTGGINLLFLRHFVFDLMKEQIQRIKARFDAMIVPYFFARVNEVQCQKDHRKAKMPKEEQEGTVTTPSCSDGRMTKRVENLRKFMD